jgi:DNA-binding XRE family transcriptional regulator
VNRSKRNDEIVQRIEYIRNYLGLNKSRFSTEIGLKPQTYNNFIGAQASKPSVELILGIVTRFGVNPGWVLGGSGPVFSERAPEQESRFAPPGATAPGMRPWGIQVAEPGRGDWGGERPEVELSQKVARLEELVRAIEKRLGSPTGGGVRGLEEVTQLLQRLHGLDPASAETEVDALKSRLERLIAEKARH